MVTHLPRLSRRRLLTRAAQLGAAGFVALDPRTLVAQALPGKRAELRALSTRPPDYETPVALLDSLLTPIDAFYVRCHMPVPAETDAAAWTLAIEGEVPAPITLRMADLRQMPSTTVTVTLECAGNGRAFFDPPVAGIQWRKGAVGTCTWTGVRLSGLLAKAGASKAATHVWMAGADRPFGTQPPRSAPFRHSGW